MIYKRNKNQKKEEEQLNYPKEMFYPNNSPLWKSKNFRDL